MQRTVEFDFGISVKAIRKRFRLSQRAFAEKLGVSKSTVAAWERSKCFPKKENFAKLMDI